METSAAIKSFFLAMTMHPGVVHLAQKELDEVLGGERLPDFSDKPRLPFVSAIMKEVLRWAPPTPLCTVLPLLFLYRLCWNFFSATPHRLMEDDVYEGWFIPAGATIFDNAWYAICPQNPTLLSS